MTPLKIFENLDFGQKKIVNLAFGQNFRKSRFWSKFSKIPDFAENYRKSCFLVNLNKKNRNLRRNFWKISISVKIVEKSRFCSKCFSKNVGCATNILKFRS